jgi:hopanoid biosynthesis associated radical SAM protein HpnH
VGIPAIQKAAIGSYILKNMLTGNRRFPLVLMLEPLFRCNLKCIGCGKINHPEEILRKQLSVEECVDAAMECGAPVVSIPGGEPLLHPEMPRVVEELAKRKKFVYLCTNALLVKKRLKEFKPSTYLTFNIHLDALGSQHDKYTGLDGVFDRAVEAIRLLLSKGFRVTTNTTLFNGETAKKAAELLDFLASLGVEGLTISPGFDYEKAQGGKEQFLEREATKNLFRGIFALQNGRKWHFNHSSLYLDFLAGNQDYACTPWGNPTKNIFGWQRPCYLLNDSYAQSYRELIEETDWSRYGVGRDPRCSNCMVHCGFEPTAVVDAVRRPLKAMVVSMRGVRT